MILDRARGNLVVAESSEQRNPAESLDDVLLNF